MRLTQYVIASAVALGIVTGAQAESAREWFKSGHNEARQSAWLFPNTGVAKNVILFVGDGMGVSTVTAARILEGQLRGETGEENELVFETLPYLSLAKTYNTNQQTPDSAGTMTAMMTGAKTKAGIIGVDQQTIRGDCASSQGHELKTFLEEAEEAGLSTGIVSTARITHATPAATYAHVPERDWEDDHDMPQAAKDAGCKDIARQLIEFPYGDGIEVAMGGGRRSFLPRSMEDPEVPGNRGGERDDGRNLAEEWAAAKGSEWVWNKQQFDVVNPAKVKRLLGLFNSSHMQYNHDINDDAGGEPSIAEMTGKAIDILKKNRKGFFLMVEGGRIDHAHHAGNAYRALDDTIAMAEAVKTALHKTSLKDTLIIVTADHSHVFTIAGYPTRGNPILGKVVSNDSTGEPKAQPELALDGMPYTTLGYANGLGFASLETGGDTRYGYPAAPGRVEDLTGIDTEDEGFHQEATVPLGSETHAAEDIAIYAGGPWAHLFHKTHEQNYVYHVMSYAARLPYRSRHRFGHAW